MSNPLITGMEPNQTVLVTAGANGIGKTIAETFLAHGAQVHICDVNPSDVQAFVETHPNATGTVADVSSIKDVERMFDELSQHYGKLDILVNNAGIAGPTAAVEDIKPEDWERTIAIDLNGQFYVSRLAIPLLKQAGGGSIINLSSNAGLYALPLRAPYTAAKWAVVGFTKTLAMELGPDNIRVNALCPCSVNGPRIDGVIERDAAESGSSPELIRKVYSRQSSLRRFVDAEDVANMALFLASHLGKNISGQAIGVDGHTEGLSNWTDDIEVVQ